MTDELKITPPSEVKGETKNIEPQKTEAKPQPVVNEHEQEARERGWLPKDEWDGNPDEWRSAREFVERGEWIGKFRAKDREIQQIKEALQFMSDQNKKIYATGYQKALTDLKTERKRALAEGDLVKADEIGDKIEDTKKALDTIEKTPNIPTQSRVDPDHEDWLRKNPWYNEPVMQMTADAMAIKYIREHGNQVPAQEVREFVTKEIKKEFAHRFNKRSAPQPDSEGRSQSGVSGKNTDSFSEVEGGMNETQRQIMKTIIKTTGMSKEDYLKQFSGQK